MPMAPHPERLQASGDTDSAEPRVETAKFVVQDPSGPKAQQLRQMYRVLQWEFNKQVLSMFETVVMTDEQWTRCRRQLLDRMNEVERSMTAQISQILGKE